VEGLYADRNNDGEITEDDKYRFEKPTADYTFGISSRFNYKEWDFSFSGRAKIGNYVYNNVASMNGNYREMFFEPLYMTNAVTSIQETRFMDPRYHSDHYVEDASFFRMDNITLGYTFEDLANQITSLRVSATVENAFVITEYSGIDPEVFGGIDNNMYPRPRTFMLGVNLNF
jgi:iron complex outermembrane receptor protein